MSASAAPLAELDGAHAEMLAERLGVLSERMLVSVAGGETDPLLALLREHREVRERLEPLISALRAAYDQLAATGDPDAHPVAGALSRLRAHLERTYEANRVLEEQAARACAALEAQLATHRKRSGAVLAYGAGSPTSGSAFTRVG